MSHPGVVVTGNHTLCLAGHPSPPGAKRYTDWHCMGGRCRDCAWMVKTMAGAVPKTKTMGDLYHIVAVDNAHRQYGVFVGAGMDIVSEMFRSSSQVLTGRLRFSRIFKYQSSESESESILFPSQTPIRARHALAHLGAP